MITMTSGNNVRGWVAANLARVAQFLSLIARVGKSTEYGEQIHRPWFVVLLSVSVVPGTVFASHAAIGVEKYARPYAMLLTPVIGILALVVGALIFSTSSSKHRAIKTLVFAFFAMMVWGAYGRWSFHQYSLLVDQLCSEAGLYVYETVDADGFIGESSINGWADEGFLYVERKAENGLKRMYSLRNGQPHTEIVDRFVSRYEIKREPGSSAGQGIKRFGAAVVDRETGAVLGMYINFTIPPSPLERKLKFLPVSSSNWVCGHNYFDRTGFVRSIKSDHPFGFFDLVTSTIRPISRSKGAKP